MFVILRMVENRKNIERDIIIEPGLRETPKKQIVWIIMVHGKMVTVNIKLIDSTFNEF